MDRLQAMVAVALAQETIMEKKRSSEAKRDFQRSRPCPSSGKSSGVCHEYVVDHVHPLASGGADNPSNMQWQTKADAKAKDKWERH